VLKLNDLNPTGIKLNTVPNSEEQLAQIPAATRADFELKPHEVKAARRFIYAVNKINRMRFMTRLDAGVLMVWRVK
jgi:hypothetical protein